VGPQCPNYKKTKKKKKKKKIGKFLLLPSCNKFVETPTKALFYSSITKAAYRK
jgi:hypothetical protein